MDASDPETILAYWRWYSSTTDGVPSDDVLIIRVFDGGAWIRKEFLVADIPGIVNSDQLRLSFLAADNGSPSNIEAGVDGVEVFNYTCGQSDCPADIDGDGDVGVTDFLELLAAWGPNPGNNVAGDRSGGEASAVRGQPAAGGAFSSGA